MFYYQWKRCHALKASINMEGHTRHSENEDIERKRTAAERVCFRLQGQTLPTLQHFMMWVGKKRPGMYLGYPCLSESANLWSEYPKRGLDSDLGHWWVNKILHAFGGIERESMAVTCHSVSRLGYLHYRNFNLFYGWREKLLLGCHHFKGERWQSTERNLNFIDSWGDLARVELAQDFFFSKYLTNQFQSH